MHKYFGVLLAVPLILAGCGGGSGSDNNHLTTITPQFTVSLSVPSVTLYPASASTKVTATITRQASTGAITLSLNGLPAGAIATTTAPGTGNSGSVDISPGTASAGTYNLYVVCSDGDVTISTPLTLVIGASGSIVNAATGPINLFMSTSFQPADWNYQLFTNFPGAATYLDNLAPQHVNMQPVYGGVPQTSATTWNFTMTDAVVNPVLNASDHSPLFQIAVAPAFMNDSNGHLLTANIQQFADYSANLVRYYNTGGFLAADGHHASTASYPIIYWGIFNEPNINNLTPSDYVQLYNTTVPEMQAVDSTLKFVAVELSDWGQENTRYLPTFVNNVTEQVDVMATHFYASCNQRDSDQQLFNTIPDFANRVRYLYGVMAPNPALANVPVWVTEDNVNADWDKGGGISVCNGTPFVLDQRGSSPYFAAWRPYMFSQMAKAGARSLHHWSFASDAQYGELNDQTGKPRLSYWVDFWLQHYFPAPPGGEILQYASTDDPELEVLPVKNPDGSVIVMVANHALASASDNNGTGAPRSVSLDVSQLGSFSSAKLLTIDAGTDVVNGPAEAPLTLGSSVELTFPGYGVAFVSLK